MNLVHRWIVHLCIVYLEVAQPTYTSVPVKPYIQTRKRAISVKNESEPIFHKFLRHFYHKKFGSVKFGKYFNYK